MDMAARRENPPQIIVVDDDPAVRSALIFAFQVDGFEVRAYESGEAVLAEPDLPGLDGLETVAGLRARGVGLPALLITTPTAIVQRRAQAADISIVEKPLMTALVERVRELIEREAAANA